MLLWLLLLLLFYNGKLQTLRLADTEFVIKPKSRTPEVFAGMFLALLMQVHVI